MDLESVARPYRPVPGIRSELTQRTQAALVAIRDRLFDLSAGDPARPPLEEEATELNLLLDDLAGQLASPRVLQAIAESRATARGPRR
jgi:hypothetical protein